MTTSHLFFLAIIVAGVLYFLLRPRRPPQAMPPPASPYARDDAFGRPPAGPAGYDPYAGNPYPGNPPQEGMGSSIARGVATGLAVGAGAVVAQEIGRRMFDHGQPGPAADAQNHASAASGADHAANVHSPLARDAGLGGLEGSGVQGLGHDLGGPDFGVNGDTGWDDAGAGLGEGGGDDWEA